MPLFQPKHQKLILQCYPAGRGFDKKPNSSELSYLLYYASTRRVKLEKVGRFLEKKNQADISRGRTGNVQVTLELVRQLMETCPDDLSVFADNVCAVLGSVAASGDLGLCQHAAPVLNTFCLTLQGDLITGDQQFVSRFVSLTEKFLQLGTKQHQANPTEWKAIALTAAASFASSKFLSLGKGKQVLTTAIPLVIGEIQDDYTEDTLLKKIASHSSEQHSLLRFNTARTAPKQDEEPSTPLEIKTDELAVAALKAFFHTASAGQLSSSTKAVSSYLARSGVDHDWAAAVIEMVTAWIPVQLRFLVVSILVSLLDKAGDQNEQMVYLHVMARLLASSVNLVGLSVIDNLRQLLTLQFGLMKDPHTQKPLIGAYSSAIISLAVHNYYTEQIVDMVSELVIKLKECIDKPTQTSQSTMMVIMENIKTIIVTAHENATVQRAFVPLELFSSTFSLLAYNDTSSPLENNFLIQQKYTEMLITDLKLEYTTKDDFVIADHNNLISNANASVINELYESIESCSKLPRGTNYDSLINLIEVVTEKFGINAAVNSLPLLFEWQLSNENEEDRSLLLRDNLAFLIVYFSTKALQSGDLVNEVLSRIDYRKTHGLWLISQTVPMDKSHSSPEFSLSKTQVESLLGEGSLLQTYRETILSTHYRYRNLVGAGDGELASDGYEDAPETSFMSQSHSQNVSLSNLLQPSAIAFSNDNNSIKSAPMSARSLLLGNLKTPNIQELRKAISGTSLKVNGYGANGNGNGTGLRGQSHGTAVSRDAITLLNDLSLGDDLDDSGRTTAF